ncbi:S1C family serine protease [Deinococcus malanensis]|uniref:S1C family serine protease n=1 Tax=Deinococcus malanensis TaxID=1706855 RepID=UPI001E310027|nr:trypsin-like peptidase domain-containing protein [Deinococcus malanensis]
MTASVPASAPAESAALEYEENTISVTDESQNGVVFITRRNQMPGTGMDSSEAGEDASGQDVTGTGSGFFVDDQGFILTNFHVVEGAQQVTVHLPDRKREFPARIVGVAPEYDLALLQTTDIPDDLYDPLELGDSDQVRVGAKAIAMGSPFGLEFSVTQGIVSAKNRVVPTGINGIPQNSIQTDAAINPGNSGGPLLNSAAEVIGINTMILSPGTAASGTGQNAGVGFAIPINTAKAILPRLKAGETVNVPRIGVTGIPVALLPGEVRQEFNLPDDGVLVQEVSPASPAAGAGLQGGLRRLELGEAALLMGGDVITRIAGQPVTTLQDIQTALVSQQGGGTVELMIQRDGETRELVLNLAARNVE